MPLKRCGTGGKGWQYGSGKCYTGPGAKKKAIKQGVAIDGPDKFKAEMSKGEEILPEELDEILEEIEDDEINKNPYIHAVKKYLIIKKE